MAKEKKPVTLADEAVISKIYYIRGQKVMLDRDLAAMYNVTTGNLNKSVKRNLKRFPEDFMFQLTDDEFKDLIFHFGISSQPEGKAAWGGTRKMPNAFTEQGVSMLSSVLNSDIAIEVNIRIIRIFTKLREMVSTHKDILLKLEQLERKVTAHDEDIRMIFDALKQLLSPPQEPRRKIGFRRKDEQE
ncbi:MAG: ORF6N domain-containing protein [Chitinophagaceae bacterium]|nr:MAG: ORF6N domain-containing protein [Chitinophagaceae bacterium]